MRDVMNQDALRWFAFRRWMQRAKRSIAIEKIKRQPFFKPRDCAGDSASIEMPLICAIDLAAHDGDHTAVLAERQGMIDLKSRRAAYLAETEGRN